MSSIDPVAAAAVSAKPSKSSNKINGSDNKTPSWTSIVEAYHREGNGDREMLLALLHAKAKEDERLAALDLLHAEQLRAYTAHISMHGSMHVAHLAHHQPGHHHVQTHYQPQAHMMHLQHGGLGSPIVTSATSPAMTQRAHANSASSGSSAISSSSTIASTSRTSISSTSSSSSSRKIKKNNNSSASAAGSRSPSLSVGGTTSTASESRLSSPDEHDLLKTPADHERRLSDISNASSGSLIAASEGSKKRKAAGQEDINPGMAYNDYRAENWSSSMMQPTTARSALEFYELQHAEYLGRPAKKLSPSAGAVAAASVSTTQSASSKSQTPRQVSPRSLVNILNNDLRPLSMQNFRTQTSDLRGSAAASDEDLDELADD